MTRIEPGLDGTVLRSSEDIYYHGGTAVRQLHFTLTPEQFEQYRTGYRCLACHSVQSEPFPEVCETIWKDEGRCGFRMREEQLRLLEFEFKGEETLWPDRTPDREREDWISRNGILVPGREE